MSPLPRRRFIGLVAGAAAGLVGSGPGRLAGAAIVHPDPRPGIDASEVMTRAQLSAFPDEIADVYDMVREMPGIADGIGCSCGCSALPGYRSLLTCFHATGMAMGCDICQGQARLAHRRFREGQTLEQIRRATDARFG